MVKGEILQEAVRGSFALPPYYLEKPYWTEPDKAGTLVGRAFQIVDDVLDYFPGTGKDRFKDLLNGKATLPLLLYTERYGSSLVERILNNPSKENLLNLFERIVNEGVFEESLKIASLGSLETCPSMGARL